MYIYPSLTDYGDQNESYFVVNWMLVDIEI